MKQLQAEGSVYTLHEIQVKGDKYTVLIVTGRNNYISIRKETNNPFKGIGKEFKNFDEATKHYKSPEMKTELLKIEMGIV